MKDYMEERAFEIGRYFISARTTVADAARIFGVSKATAHKDLTERLPRINPSMALQAKDIMDINKAQRHLRGGRMTKLKYSKEAPNE
jgi:putative DeoR family transcriptional regulator (stage III sporulation protein D)